MLQALRDLPGARTQYERALAITEAALGPDLSAVATRRNNLGAGAPGPGTWPAPASTA